MNANDAAEQKDVLSKIETEHEAIDSENKDDQITHKERNNLTVEPEKPFPTEETANTANENHDPHSKLQQNNQADSNSMENLYEQKKLELKDEIDEIDNENIELEKRYAELIAMNRDLDQKISALKQEENQQQTESDDLTTKIAEIDEKIAKMNTEIREYEKIHSENNSNANPNTHYMQKILPDQQPKFKKNAVNKGSNERCKVFCLIF